MNKRNAMMKTCSRLDGKPLIARVLRRATLAMLLVVLGFGNLCAQSMPQKDGDGGAATGRTARAESSRITPTGVTLAFGRYSTWPGSGFGETASFTTESGTGWYVNCQMSDDFEFIGWTSFFEVIPSTGVGVAPAYGGTDANNANGEISDLLIVNQTKGWNSKTGNDIFRNGFKVGNTVTAHDGSSSVPFRHFDKDIEETIWAVALYKGRYIKLNDNYALNVTTQSTQFVMKRMCVPFEVTLSLSGTYANYFELSLDGNTWRSTITVPKDYDRTAAGEVKTTTLYVRFKGGLSEGTYTASLEASSMYMNNLNTTPAYTPPSTVGNQAITLSATVLPAPTLSLTGMATSISEVQIGEATVSASNIVDDVTVTLGGTNSSDFEISKTGNDDDWHDQITYVKGSSTSITSTFKVRIKQNVMGKKTLTATLTAATQNATSAEKIINGTVTPTLTVPTTTISWDGLAAKSFSISGTRLSGNNVTVSTTSTSTPTSDFEISQDKDNWGSSVQVSGTNVNSGVTLYVRMKNGLTPGSHSGFISVTTSDVVGSKSFDLDGTLSEIWQENITEAPDDYQAASINTPDAFVWCLKQGDDGTLTQDVDLSEFIWNPVSNFSGTFNGNGHVITGLTNQIDGTPVKDPGMFASITTGATVENIIVKDCEFVANKADNFFGIIANEMTGGTVSGCMVSGTLTGSGKLGGIVGQLNGGIVHSCISQVAPTDGGSIVHTFISGSLRNSFTNAGKLYYTTSRSTEIQNCVSKEDGSWKYVDESGNGNDITIQGFGYNQKGCVIESDENTRLVDIMNAYAKTKSYTLWAQPLTTSINDGVPVMKQEGKNTVVQNGDKLDYGDLSAFISGENPMLFYGSKEYIATTSYTGNNLYIDEDAALKVTGDGSVKAHTSRFLKNGDLEWWHHYASPVADQSLGISYTTYEEMSYNEPCGASITGSTFFPASTTNWDLYCFYEPAYHWINFKRNSLSHWKSDNHTENIPYTNETELKPGKGYLVALGGSSYIQATGNLNHTTELITINVDVTKTDFVSNPTGEKLSGYNLIGNPFQSYLNFQAFASKNAPLWGSETTATYLTYNPELKKYQQGTVTTASKGSAAETGNISMHQGFFIVVNSSSDGKAKFSNDMCSINPDGDVQFRGESYAFPLVNLIARDNEGVGDVAVVEFDRPEFVAAPKMFNYGGKGKVYFSYENEDDALLFLSETIDQLPVHFDAFEDGDYTLSWSTANADFSYLHLIDNMTGADIDMLATDSYRFSATTSDYKSRFKMKFAYTGIGENEDAEHVEVFAFVHDGNLIVNGQGMMEIIDMNGRTVSKRQLNGEQNTVGIQHLSPSIYIVRLVSNNSINVQKIIVK